MSTSNPAQGTYEEAASVDHIRALIADARGDVPERVSVVERIRQEWWAAKNPDEVARLISNTRRRGAADEMILDRDWSKSQTRDFTVVGIVHRFFVLTPPGTRTGALSAVVIFSTDPHLARKDATSEMIRVLQEISRKHLDEYNYDLLDESLSVNYELQWEIGAVKSSYGSFIPHTVSSLKPFLPPPGSAAEVFFPAPLKPSSQRRRTFPPHGQHHRSPASITLAESRSSTHTGATPSTVSGHPQHRATQHSTTETWSPSLRVRVVKNGADFHETVHHYMIDEKLLKLNKDSLRLMRRRICTA
ncbi:uncharacterized protein DS421_13g420460 [Arachis hypogaea]|nr:uncharacterized protein DS421_13g420460 [Arachis hypogaea]